jgi:hypothetical protein
MSAKPALARHKDNISDLKLVAVNPLDHKCFARPDGREHAPARRRKTKFAERTQNLSRKAALHRVGSFSRGSLWLPHDFVFKWQAPCVGSILPHPRADVTNTCSYRKPGFS